MEISLEESNEKSRYAEVVEEGLRIIKTKYGSNKDDGYEPLRYHNLIHTRKVVDSVERMSDMAIRDGKITQRQKELMMIAACYHDIEQDMGIKNEEESGQIAEFQMRKMGGFSVDEISIVKKIISGTRCFWDSSGHLAQATDGTDVMEAIVADADMNNAGESLDVFIEVSLNLAVENSVKEKTDEVDMKKFWKFQERFLKDRKFFTHYAESMFPNIRQNTEYVARQIKLLEGVSNHQ